MKYDNERIDDAVLASVKQSERGSPQSLSLRAEANTITQTGIATSSL